MKISVVPDIRNNPPIFIYKNYSSKSYGDIPVQPISQNDPDIPEHNSYSNFFKISCDIGYYQLLIPFRFKRNVEGGWDLHKSTIQQVAFSTKVLFKHSHKWTFFNS